MVELLNIDDYNPLPPEYDKHKSYIKSYSYNLFKAVSNEDYKSEKSYLKIEILKFTTAKKNQEEQIHIAEEKLESWKKKNKGNKDSTSQIDPELAGIIVQESKSKKELIETNLILEFLKLRTQELKIQKRGVLKDEKIKWNGTPSQFAHVFLELAKKSFIEIPSTRGQGSMRKFAKLCFSMFEIKTTEENLINEFQIESSLTPANKSMFTIPDIKDIK